MLELARGFGPLFHESTTAAMRNILGEGGMRAALFHLGLDKVNDVQVIHQKLLSLFGPGTPVLERAIVKEVFASLEISYYEADQFDFEKELQYAYERFARNTERRKES